VRGKVEANRGPNGGAVPTTPAADDEDRFDVEPAKILAESVYAWDDPRLAAWRKNSTVHVRIAQPQATMIGSLRHVFETHHGDCPVVLHVHGSASVDEIALPGDFAVDPGPGLERAVEGLVGDGSYRVEIHRERAPERELRGAARTR
jgi:hypothetical protein